MISATIEFSPSIVDTFRHRGIQRLENAALYATDKAIRRAHRYTQAQVMEVGLGRMRKLVAVTSDLEKGTLKRYGAEGFSASGVMFQKKRSPRLDGIFESYGRGSVIRPRNGGYLWFPTDDIKRLGIIASPNTGGGKGKRGRISPGNWAAAGLVSKIGPLVFIFGKHSGERLAIVRNVGVNAAGKPGSARSLKRNGTAKKGDVQRDFIVAFIGIKQTVRAQRFDAQQNRIDSARGLQSDFSDGMRKGGR